MPASDIPDIFLARTRASQLLDFDRHLSLLTNDLKTCEFFIEDCRIPNTKSVAKKPQPRIRRTLENLERLADIREELERQLQPFNVQAGRREYRFKQENATDRALRRCLAALDTRSLPQPIIRSRSQMEASIAGYRAIEAESSNR